MSKPVFKFLESFLNLVGYVPRIIFSLLWISTPADKKDWLANDWSMKRLIEIGVFKWTDAPHLHSYLIHKRIDFDFWLERKVNPEYDQMLESCRKTKP